MACARFWRNGGCAVLQTINGSRSTICRLRKSPNSQERAQNAPQNRATVPQPNVPHPMRRPRVYVIVSGRPHVVARRVSRILKTKSEVHLL
jgi:hypothetical protein